MQLQFLDRSREFRRLRQAWATPPAGLVCVYGRRRLGKSRLLREALEGKTSVYFVADQRDAALQRRALARQISSLLPGFHEVEYPSWEVLLEHWERRAPAGAILVLDELPYLVASAAELPSMLQSWVDRPARRTHVVLCGSSQRMMHSLVLDGTSPLYGRAREALRVGPLPFEALVQAFRVTPTVAVEHHAVWGGVPRYWEMAVEHASRSEAIASLVLDPLGPLHREPDRLLADEQRDVARPASILSLIGAGCHRLSEIGGRLGIPGTALSRPLALLQELGLVRRELPFGSSLRDSKRTYYVLADSFLRFWYRFVEPNRSRLEAGQIDLVLSEVEDAWPDFLGHAWEDLARESVARVSIRGGRWKPASRWWGPGLDRRPLELDVVAESARDPRRVLVGEAKLTLGARQAAEALAELRSRAARCPALQDREVIPTLWVLRWCGAGRDEQILTAADLVGAE